MGDQIKRVDPPKNRGGEWIRFGDEEYKVPALGFLAVIDLQDDVAGLADIKGAPSPEQAKTVTEIVFRALRRNYPEIAREEVADMIDLANFEPVLKAVLNVSGFVRGGANGAGEPVASTGTVSTPH